MHLVQQGRALSRIAFLALAIMTFLSSTFHAGATEPEVMYGSRAGMTLTVMSKKGIGTSKASIRVKHTRQDARNFCREYANDPSEKCIRDTLNEVKIDTRVTADCRRGLWNDAGGSQYVLVGSNTSGDSMADYMVKNFDTGDILDGSSASGYWVAMGTLKALCPRLID